MVLHLEKFENIFEEAEPTGTFDTSRSEFLNLGSVDILDQLIGSRGLPCALWDGQQHLPVALPTQS